MKIDRAKLVERFGDDADFQTAAWQGLAEELEGIHVRSALEIGTMHGLSAAVLTECADKVVTLDLVDRPIAGEVLSFLGVQKRVWRVVVKDEVEKEGRIAKMYFHLAFVDANHSREDVARDFALVKRCGRVLFHDYPVAGWTRADAGRPYLPWQHYAPDAADDGVGFLLDAIGPAGTIIRHTPFAWWFARGDDPIAQTVRVHSGQESL